MMNLLYEKASSEPDVPERVSREGKNIFGRQKYILLMLEDKHRGYLTIGTLNYYVL